MTADLDAMATLLADHGGRTGAVRISGATAERGPAAAWRQSFLRAPYLRDAMVDAGLIAETFETAVTFDRLHELVERVLR